SPGEANPGPAVTASAPEAISFSVAGGLNSPRGTAFGPDGFLYVAEAGTGGSHSTVGECQQVPPPVGPYTGGPTARISKISPEGDLTTVVDGLPSALDGMASTNGVADIAFLRGELYALLAGGGCSHGNPDVPASVIRVNSDGSWDVIADLGAWYKSHPVKNMDSADFEPDGQWYSMVAARGALYVLEANGGALHRVTPDGVISRISDLSRERPWLSTPTALDFYRGKLTVGTFGRFTLDGSEKILSILELPGGRDKFHTFMQGVTAVLGLAHDRRNRLYALESLSPAGFFPGSGRLLRLHPPSGTFDVVATGLEFPTGLTAGPDGVAFYVSNRGFGFPPGAGQILRLEVQ
ncbi:MAG: ScyD/ScyE family protein, partial [Gemmatimonadales bacterium]